MQIAQLSIWKIIAQRNKRIRFLNYVKSNATSENCIFLIISAEQSAQGCWKMYGSITQFKLRFVFQLAVFTRLALIVIYIFKR